MSTIYKFGPHTISPGQVFLATKYSLGLVNLKPILPGHVLVISRRNVPRFLDLTPDEVSDIFQSAQRVGKAVEREYGGTSLTIACQDGPAAGQSVPHCHVHIIPRRLGDFANNDDIYQEITEHTNDLLTQVKTMEFEGDAKETGKKGVDFDERKPRSEQEMAEEATRLASLLEQLQQEQQQQQQ
ncbi:HIT-like domain-containing protein [Mortierella sp. GBAus27b]|nr:HIT-like domain-containing protein [Mortierella sp. GBAus27b]